MLILSVFTLLGASCTTSTKVPDGGVFKSIDQGKVWKQVVFVAQGKKVPVTIGALNVKQLVMSPFDTTRVWAVGGADGIYETTNAGDSWHPFFKGTAQALALHPTKPDIMYVATGNRIMRTIDGAKSWQGVYLDNTPESIITSLRADSRLPQVLYAGTSHGDLLKTEDEGGFWRPVYYFKGRGFVASINFSSANVKVIYAAQSDGNLWRTADGGLTWVNLVTKLKGKTRVDVRNFRSMVTIPGKDGLLLANRYGLFRTVDGGETWENIKLLTAPLTVDINVLSTNPNNEKYIYYSAAGTFYRSTNAGLSWETIPLPSRRISTSLIIHPTDPSIMYLGFSR